ncbi:MAG: ABC transporter substrate-binding protein [Armatimonadota bacterium]
MRLSASYRFALPLLCLAVIALVLSGCPKPSAPTPPVPQGDPAKATPNAVGPTGEPIVIGAIFSVTGPGAPLGEPEKASAQMVEKKVNDAGGINGRPLKLVIEDDATEESKAVLAAKKLIEQDKAVAIIGPTMSGPSLAILDTCNKASIPLVSCAASAKITNPVAERKWVFSTAQTDVLAVQRLLDYLKAKQIKSVALICDSNAFGQSGAEQLKKQLPTAGIKIVDEEKFGTKDTSMTAQLTKIKAAKPAAVICWGTNPGPAVVAKNAKSLGLTMPMIMSHGIANKKFIELAADAAEGVVFPAGKLLVTGELADSDAQKAVLKQYGDDFQAFAQKPGNTFGGHAYDAMQLIIAALKGGAKDAAGIRDAVEKTTKYVGIGGTFNFSATDHSGLTKDAFTLVTIKAGKWTMVK